ncbi:helix-turn-helix domain-containing protein [Actinomadura rugatobispora]|uniref:Helix-turn-helix domain-containing protein n=1 Tax=Actinomadura rugatobispora TaxID=1994 RepID=A0ABW1A9A9_9ACTN|nr:helix-turn-helix transcriptional regulator [Actinomadura rugatobispora]
MSASLVLRRRLAAELRALRLAHQLSQDEVARELDVSSNKIVRIENAQSSVSTSDLKQLLSLFQVDADTRDRLLDLGRDARKRGGWWSAYHDLLPGPYVQLEAAAAEIRNYQPTLLPGLLQTPEYMRSLMHSTGSALAVEEAERRITARLQRQARLTSADPLVLHALIDEAALRRTAGQPQIAGDQFRHLIEMAALDNVHLRVVPYTAGLYPSAGHPFVILGFPEPVDPDVVLVENRAGERYFDNAQEVGGFHADFKHIAESSLSEKATLVLLRRTLSETMGR